DGRAAAFSGDHHAAPGAQLLVQRDAGGGGLFGYRAGRRGRRLLGPADVVVRAGRGLLRFVADRRSGRGAVRLGAGRGGRGVVGGHRSLDSIRAEGQLGGHGHLPVDVGGQDGAEI